MNVKPFLSLTALCLVAFSFQTTAQIAIKAGVNLASIAESSTEETYADYKNKSVTGFQAGLAFDLGLSSLFTIQPEILFIQKGGKTTYAVDDNNKIDYRYYYNYVEVPVLAKLKFYGSGDNGSGFYFVAGPFAGLAMGGKTKTTTTLLGVSTTREDDFNFDNNDSADRQKRMDWGLSFGGGVKLGAVILDLRYNLGINNLLDNDANNNNDNKPYRRTRGIGLTAGFEF